MVLFRESNEFHKCDLTVRQDRFHFLLQLFICFILLQLPYSVLPFLLICSDHGFPIPVTEQISEITGALYPRKL